MRKPNNTAGSLLTRLIATIIGAIIGGVIGLIVVAGTGSDGFNSTQQEASVPIGILICGIIGIVCGAYLGWIAASN